MATYCLTAGRAKGPTPRGVVGLGNLSTLKALLYVLEECSKTSMGGVKFMPNCNQHSHEDLQWEAIDVGSLVQHLVFKKE